MEKSKSKFEIINQVINDKNNLLTVKELCDLAGVSKSGYYRWLNAADSRKKREEKDRQDFCLILEAYSHRGYPKGAKGIYMYLLHREPQVIMNLKKIRRLMKKFGLVCTFRGPNPYRRMAKALKTSNYADNLVNREFEEHGPRHILLTDITYIPLNDKFVYLSVIMDAFTKEVLSYALSDNLRVDFVLETLDRLIDKYGDALDEKTIIHSDQGAHYTSHRFIELVKDKGLRQSMSRRGNCWDNAPQESFFGHMKDEIGEDVRRCSSYDEVKSVIDDWINYYNNERYQWDLAKLSPVEYYEYITTGIYPIKKVQT